MIFNYLIAITFFSKVFLLKRICHRENSEVWGKGGFFLMAKIRMNKLIPFSSNNATYL
jgi:hypothetical protein